MKERSTKESVIDIGVRLRPYQEEVDTKLKRFNVLCWHRRAGKSFYAAWRLIKAVLIALKLGKKKNLRYAYIAQTKESARNIIWDYLKDFTKTVPGVHYNEQRLVITIKIPGFTKVEILLLGAESYNSIRGQYFDGIVADEFSEWDPKAWRTVIRPCLADRRGWAILIGTSKGPNHFSEMYERNEGRPNWQCLKVTWDMSLALPMEEIEDARREMTPEEFAQEYECSFSGSKEGFYYAHIIKQLEENQQIINLPHVPTVEVCTFWDLGISDYMVVWFIQKVAGQIRVIDYEEHTGLGIPQMVKLLREKPYNYSYHILPHDGAHRSVDTGKTRKETLEELIDGYVVTLPRTAVQDGIDMARSVMVECFFCSVKAAKGIKALRSYQKQFDAKREVYLNTPLHNWASHGADAFRTFAMGVQYIEYATKKTLRKRQERANMDYDCFS